MIDELVRTVHGDFSLTLMVLSLMILMEGTTPSEFGWRFFLKNLEVCWWMDACRSEVVPS